MQKEQLLAWLAAGLKSAGLGDTAVPALERPKQADHGDFATNIALQLAKPLGKNPREVATMLKAALDAAPHPLVTEVTIAGPGFINIRLNPAAKFSVVADALNQREKFGLGNARSGEKVLVEFVSANPTGPLHTGHARQAALGDTLCNLLETQGCTVHREFYYNDAGNQIDNLTRSVIARINGVEPDDPDWPADGYQGAYINTIAKDIVFLSALNATIAIKDLAHDTRLEGEEIQIPSRITEPFSVDMFKATCQAESTRFKFPEFRIPSNAIALLDGLPELSGKPQYLNGLFAPEEDDCWFGATEENLRSVNGARQWLSGPQTRRVRIRLMAKFGTPRGALNLLGRDDESDDLNTVIRDLLNKLSKDEEFVRHYAVAFLRKEQQIDLKAFSLRGRPADREQDLPLFDCYYLESSLYTDGRVDKTVAALQASGHTYESEGALWLKTTDYGDDKDRVMRKAAGGYTYFVPDVAYHVTKWERGFTQVVNIQGTDHHGTIARVRAGLQALNIGIPTGYPDYLLHSMVRVMKGGEEVKISKRAGSYVTLGELIEWVGKDAVRFFLVSRKADSEFTFDIDLALSQSEENPVFYVQYAHARICSVLREAAVSDEALAAADLALLTHEKAEALATKLADYPALLATTARDLAPHLLPYYLREVAAAFHAYYAVERIRVDDPALRAARTALADAAAQVLKNGLQLLGVSAPERM